MSGGGQRSILFVTGTRADFGKMKPLMQKIRDDPGFDIRVFVTGMHTLARYGSTYDEIRKSGFANLHLFLNQTADGGSEMDLVLANTVHGLGLYVREFPPDLIVIHGDRVETIAGAIVGVLNNILVAHVEGGERSGTVDDLLRHATTKLSHLHFVANEEAKGRLVQMGELPGSVHVVGSPDVDVMLSPDLPSLAEVRERYEITFKDYHILLYHPVTTEVDLVHARAEALVDAVLEDDHNYVVIYPNNDMGAQAIIAAYKRLAGNPRFRIFPSLRFEHFLTLLQHAEAIVGNSSAGIREAPVYGVPTVNLGSRQADRYHYASIVHADEDKGQILHALRHLHRGAAPSMHFGSGNSAGLFLRTLQDPKLWATSKQKRFRDLPAPPRARQVEPA